MNTAMDPRLAHLLGLTEKLGSMIEVEADLIERNRIPEIAKLSAERSRLGEAYLLEMESLRADPAWLKSQPPAHVARLGEATHRFQDLATRHRRSLSAAKTDTERVLKTVSEEACRRQSPAHGYGPPANRGMGQGAYAHRAVSLAVDRVI